MAKRNTSDARRKPIVAAVVILLAIISVIFGRFNSDFEEATPPDYDNASVSSEAVTVHIINVGQGSSALIQCGESGFLIDAGESEYGETVVSYLKKAGIKKLDYVVASHPHTDHIGGLTDVFDSFDVDNIIMPHLTQINIPTTRSFERFLKKIDEKNIHAVEANYGDKYKLGNASLEILGPVEQNKDLNNMSVVCKVKAAGTTFIFPGDAEKEEMESIENYNPNLKCNIMIMAHHGSNTSLDERFLGKADFDVAVISCGQNNSYGHPHEEIIDYLKSNNIEYYRTDLAGNIVFTCTAEGYSINTGF
ncbi:MAG: ComEC/Rec2 family competence protein [Acutalibacteraceae bacterium]